MGRHGVVAFIFGVLTAVTLIYLDIILLKYYYLNTSEKPVAFIDSPVKWEKFLSENLTLSNVYDANHSFQRELEVPKCEVLHITFVCAGYNSTRSFVTVVKSILFYRKNPLHFHLITDSVASYILKILFKSWAIPKVEYSFYNYEAVRPEVEWIANNHYSGIYGLLKLTLVKILPKSLSKVIVLDTDVTLATNIVELWKLFLTFSGNQSIGLVENQSDWYLGRIWHQHKPWPALGRGFNSGVILLSLLKLRLLNWDNVWRKVAEKNLATYGSTSLADQDIFNAVILEKQDIVRRLPCFWNVQLSDHTRSETCYSDAADIKIIHWNSPRKSRVKNKHSQYFRNLYLTFVEYDGNLLRRDLFGCKSKLAPIEANSTGMSTREMFEEHPCYDFYLTRTANWRIHVYFLRYNYVPKDEHDVTLVAQLSVDRLQMLELLCNHWPGPMSIAVYISDAEAQQLIRYTSQSDTLRSRLNIGYHVVYKEGMLFPINALRNTALRQVTTPFAFLTDIDFLPPTNLYDYLRKSAKDMQLGTQEKLALVIPAFETQRYRTTVPPNKAVMAKLYKSGEFLSFRKMVWPKGHAPTDYNKWIVSTEPYEVNWKPDYEPYILVRRDVTPYDERFVGFGWNKVSHITELYARSYRFVVLPDAFIVHLPHSPSFDIGKFRGSKDYRRCLKIMKNEFIRQLRKKYVSKQYSLRYS